MNDLCYIYIDSNYRTKLSKFYCFFLNSAEGERKDKKDKYAGSNIILELYYYDKKKTNSTADEIVKSVKDNGTFSIYGLPDVTAYLSDNGNYLMIYTDTAIDKTNPDKNSDNYKHREQVIKDFKAFKK